MLSEKLKRDESGLYGTVWIEDSTYTVTGLCNYSSDGWGSLWLRPEFGSTDPQGFELSGTVPTSKDVIRGKITVYRQRWNDIAFQDSVTAIKQ